MPHSVGFGKVVPILTLTDWRMIVRDLLDAVCADFVEPRVSDVADDSRSVFDHRNREDASHPVPLRICSGEAEDFVIGDRNSFPDALPGATGLTFQAASNHTERNIGGLFAGGVSTDAVDHKKNAAVRIEVKTIFIVGAHQARMAVARTPQLRPRDHQVLFSLSSEMTHPGQTGHQDEQGGDKEVPGHVQRSH